MDRKRENNSLDVFFGYYFGFFLFGFFYAIFNWMYPQEDPLHLLLPFSLTLFIMGFLYLMYNIETFLWIVYIRRYWIGFKLMKPSPQETLIKLQKTGQFETISKFLAIMFVIIGVLGFLLSAFISYLYA